MASQLEQLLTCCICLDRFRNPKLLPCQHSVCMEPCMEGLVDYVRRQVKCPECRAEHRIPYNGVQGYPTNVTLQRFLEAHLEITGELPDPHTGQIMERCGVCNEKNYLTSCSHCDRKICDDCKSAHNDILKREIGRINNQVKRAMNRLKDQQNVIARHLVNLKNNSDGVQEEIENINRRLSKAVRDRCNHLKSEADKYYNMEFKNLQRLKEGLEQEISNAESNCELAEKHMDDQTDWDDCELMDAKDIFLKTMEFIRSFDYDTGDFSRKARFNTPDDLNKIASQLSTMGEFYVPQKQQLDPYASTSSLPAGLMKSKSDHRLTAQFRDQDDGMYGSGRTSPNMRRKFGDRPVPSESTDEASVEIGGRRRFRSRFIRRDDEEDRIARPSEEEAPKVRPRAIDTEDVSRGPLSGITRMSDSPRVIQRLQEKASGVKKVKEETTTAAAITPPKTTTYTPPQRKTLRQQSNEDEIDKIKKQNKSETPASPSSTTRPTYDRVSTIKENRSVTERTTPSPRASTHSSPPNQDNHYPSSLSRKTSVDVGSSAYQRNETYSRSSSTSSVGESSRRRSSRPMDTGNAERSNSSDSNQSADLLASRRPSAGASVSAKGSSGSSRFQSRFLGRAATPTADASKESDNEEDEDEETSEEETDSEDSEETSDEEEDEDEEEEKPVYSRSSVSSLRKNSQSKEAANMSSKSGASDSGYGSRYASSDNSSNNISSKYNSATGSRDMQKQESLDSKYPYSSGQGSSRAKFDELRERRQRLARSRSSAGIEDEEESSSSTQRTRGGPREDNTSSRTTATNGDDSSQLSNWAKYLKNKYGNKTGTSGGAASSSAPSASSSSAISRSRSSHLLGLAKESDHSEDDSKNADATPTSQQAGIPAPTAFGNIHRSQSLQKQRTILKIGSRGSEPGNFTWPRGIAVGPDNGIVVADSSNHRVQVFSQNGVYKKDFGRYGNSEGEFDCLAGVAVNQSGEYIIADRYNHRIQVFDRSGNFLRCFGSQGNSDGKFSYPWGLATDSNGYIYVCDKENHRVQVFHSDGRFSTKFGTMGNKADQLEHPHYIAVSAEGRVIVSDSNNHRIQIFNSKGGIASSFGKEGSEEGQFKFPRGLAVDQKGNMYVADSGNNRIQIFNSNGEFLKAFGCWGSGDSEFKGLEGVAVMPNGNILVCDRENHRVQVFQAI